MAPTEGHLGSRAEGTALSVLFDIFGDYHEGDLAPTVSSQQGHLCFRDLRECAALGQATLAPREGGPSHHGMPMPNRG